MLKINGRKGFKRVCLVHSTNPSALSGQLEKGLGLRVCAVGNVGRKYPLKFNDASKFPADRPLWLLHVEKQAFVFTPQDKNADLLMHAFQGDRGLVGFKDLEAAMQSIQMIKVSEWAKDRRKLLDERNISPNQLTVLQMAQIQSAAGMSEVKSIDLQFVGVDALGASPSLYGMIHFQGQRPVEELHLCTNIEAGIIHYPLMPHEFGRTKFGASHEILPTFFELDL